MTDAAREQHLANMRYHLTEAEKFFRAGWPGFAELATRCAADELELALKENA